MLCPGYNPFIYGNDVDSVDIATRVAMVGLLGNFQNSDDFSTDRQHFYV